MSTAAKPLGVLEFQVVDAQELRSCLGGEQESTTSGVGSGSVYFFTNTKSSPCLTSCHCEPSTSFPARINSLNGI